MSTYFLLDPFEFPYYFYRIHGELVYALSIFICIPSTFCPTLGHHQGRMYYYKMSIMFNEICINGEMLPKYTYFKLHDPAAHKYNSTLEYRRDLPLMMAQSRAESTRDTYNYGKYINQFPPNTIKVIREFERIQKKICRHKMSIMFNEICIYIYIPVISSHHPKTMDMDNSYIEYMRDFVQIHRSAWCMAIAIYSFLCLYKKTCIQSVYNVTGRKLNHG